MANQQLAYMVTYESNGQKLELTTDMVIRFLVSGNGRPTEQEIVMFLELCKAQHLNPFLREAYLIKYSDNFPASIVVGKEVFEKRAHDNPNYMGTEAGVIVITANNELVYRAGALILPNVETLVGGWACVYVKGLEKPIRVEVSIGEYEGRNKDGTPTKPWQKMPATMIQKVALSQALRRAFPKDLQGMYSEEEMSQAIEINPAPTTPQQQKQLPAAKARGKSNALDMATPKQIDDAKGALIQAATQGGRHALEGEWHKLPQPIQAALGTDKELMAALAETADGKDAASNPGEGDSNGG